MMNRQDTQRSNRQLNARLLNILKNAGSAGLKPEAAAKSAGVSVGALARDIRSLQEAGFEVLHDDSVVRLVRAPDVLLPAEIETDLDTRTIGRRIAVFEQTASTNDAAWQAAAEGAPDGTVIFAEEQTAGRGRLGRTWASPRGGLWLSMILRPGIPADNATVLTIAASVGVARAIRAYARCAARIKWPNDILIAGKKVAGILAETRSAYLAGTYVLGIGINANCIIPNDLASIATAVSEQAKQPVRRAELAREFLRSFDELYQQIKRGDSAAIGEQWRSLSSTIGRSITISQNGRIYKGEVVDIDPVDGLMVRLDRGFIRAFKGEHVTVVK